MFWLFVMAVIVMAVGFVATMMIGESKGNKESDPNYFKHTGKKWGRLTGIYVVCILVLAVIMILVGTGK